MRAHFDLISSAISALTFIECCAKDSSDRVYGLTIGGSHNSMLVCFMSKPFYGIVRISEHFRQGMCRQEIRSPWILQYVIGLGL